MAGLVSGDCVGAHHRLRNSYPGETRAGNMDTPGGISARMAAEEGELFIEDCGFGPAVVLLHGTPSLPGDFQPLVDALAPRHRVLVPHLPGYGKTPPDSNANPRSLYGVIARLEDQLTRSGLSEMAVVGFSGGAYKAVAMALRARVAVHRLALIAPVIGLDPPAARFYREMATAVQAGAFDPKPTWLDRMASPGIAERDPAAASRILAWLDAVSLSVVCDELVAVASAPDLRCRVAELACPLLVIAGMADQAVPPDSSEAVAASCSRGAFLPIEAAGHALLVEAPERMIRVLVEFLAKG
jgi:pimeloyl-ACP methyl ester carboxylesterase